MLDDGSQQDVETRSVEAKGVGLGRAIEFLSTPAQKKNRNFTPHLACGAYWESIVCITIAITKMLAFNKKQAYAL